MDHTYSFIALWLCMLVILTCCQMKKSDPPPSDPEPGTYGHDAAFLRKHTPAVVELADNHQRSKILVSPAYQGRVMTSTAQGDGGVSFGWINYDLIASGEVKQQFNPVGGEERFWLGPEGGQYALHFKQGDPFDIGHWQVLPVIDTVTYEASQVTASEAVFTSKATLVNYSGTSFEVGIERKVTLLAPEAIGQKLGAPLPEDVDVVGYETTNTITNQGSNDWVQEKGLLSIWLLGMMTPSDQTFVIIPFKPGAGSRALITDDYFGTIPPGRLVVKDSVLYFTCDGKLRSKIGLSPRIAKPLAASYDFRRNVLTVIRFPVEENGLYVNAAWKLQDEPYKGDVVNSYNDGPQPDGTQMGPFYEIESSSDARALKKGESQSHTQLTCHFQGDYEILRTFARQLLGVDLDEVKK